MLRSSTFWAGVIVGVAGVWGYHKYAAKKAAASA